MLLSGYTCLVPKDHVQKHISRFDNAFCIVADRYPRLPRYWIIVIDVNDAVLFSGTFDTGEKAVDSIICRQTDIGIVLCYQIDKRCSIIKLNEDTTVTVLYCIERSVVDFAVCNGVLYISTLHDGHYEINIESRMRWLTADHWPYPYGMRTLGCYFAVFNTGDTKKVYAVCGAANQSVIYDLTDHCSYKMPHYITAVQLVRYRTSAYDNNFNEYTARWSPKLHRRLPTDFRTRILAVLLCLHDKLLPELLQLITREIFLQELPQWNEYCDTKLWQLIAGYSAIRVV